MKDKSVITRLKRYSAHAIGHALDEDFAEAVHDAAEMIDSLVDDLQEAIDTINRKDRELSDCKGELCLRCGEYRQRHLGACDGCRWKEY